MNRTAQLLYVSAVALTLIGCVHGRVSNLPIKVNGVEGNVYIYQGRDNFAHQQTAAENMMANFCANRHPGSRVSLLKKDVVDLGTVSFGSSSTSLSGSAIGTTYGNTTSIIGSGTASTYGSASTMRNFDQRLFFQCVLGSNAQSGATSSGSSTQSSGQNAGSSNDSSDITTLKGQLEELRDLVEEGLITEDDYQKKKADLLKDID